MKILNLYAGIGGNRKLWGDEHEITAVEYKPEIAAIYRDFFPNDIVVIADAHQYLLEYFAEFDFIWASPPCPTHSQARRYLGVESGQNKPVYPDMKLYEEIIFLKHHHKGKYVVENVIAYYEPLIRPTIAQRHHFWANFHFPDINLGADSIEKGNIKEWEERFGYDLTPYKVDKRRALRNCVHPLLGKHILDWSQKEWHHTKTLL